MLIAIVAIGQIALEKSRARIDRAPMPFAQIIEDDDFVAFIEQKLGADAADVARAADDENFHARENAADASECQKDRSACGARLLFCRARQSCADRCDCCARGAELADSLLRTPFQNIDVDMAHPPFSHGEAIGLVKIDRVRADQRRSVIVDLEDFIGVDDAEFRPKRKTRPIGGRALHIAARRAGCRRVAPATRFGVRVRSGAHL